MKEVVMSSLPFFQYAHMVPKMCNRIYIDHAWRSESLAFKVFKSKERADVWLYIDLNEFGIYMATREQMDDYIPTEQAIIDITNQQLNK